MNNEESLLLLHNFKVNRFSHLANVHSNILPVPPISTEYGFCAQAKLLVVLESAMSTLGNKELWTRERDWVFSVLKQFFR